MDENDGLICSFHNSGKTVEIVGERMIVRKGAMERLLKARDELESLRSGLRLKIFYAYRALEVQQDLYASAVVKARSLFPNRPVDWQLQYAHVLSAKPEVAGHPTGAAMDITLFDLETDQDVDMGVPVYREAYRAAGRKIYTESPEITGLAMENRLFLREIMSSAGFAPFSGEFWHFSFGDCEWAAKLGKSEAFYGQLSVDQVLDDLKKGAYGAGTLGRTRSSDSLSLSGFRGYSPRRCLTNGCK
ncbi:D-alanyl-D-alanine carboxypeptidase family protein [Candidatus Gracilibacteria bacterium]|nr:D-alanyl-D-alanine carboxypeptidase family protein [Candidatus Gracilibacteria bacterium]